ncbi:MAG: hypothetical protein IPL46_30540 [Saprospiraceae bacterium]|nr:hypothetical protein [Saprospiraceae bacterium]
MRDYNVKQVNDYNAAVFDQKSSLLSRIRDQERRQSANQNDLPLLRNNLKKMETDYLYAEQSKFLQLVLAVSVWILTCLFFKFGGVHLSINGWPPVRPGGFGHQRPIITAGYIFLFMAFAIQLWYALEIILTSTII